MNLDLEVQDHLAPSGYIKLPNVSGQLWDLGFTICHIIKVTHSYFFFLQLLNYLCFLMIILNLSIRITNVFPGYV